MVSAMRHRGSGRLGRDLARDARAGLCHARLSIVDLAGGQQPLANEDETLWVVFNGEIFNYVELRAELEDLGHRFRTRSDTEVIVHAWEAWGERAFARFNGQFAIALWDERDARLVLARDRVGVRPLHVAEHGGRLYFASEVKAIFAANPDIPRALDPVGLDETFTFKATVAPPQHVLAGVSEVPPGHVRVYAGGAVTERPFHRPRYPLDGGARLYRQLSMTAVVAVREACSPPPPRSACCAPTCRWGATSRAASTARSSPRSDRGPRAAPSPRSRSASPTRSTTRPSSSGRWSRSWAAYTTR